MQRTSRAHSSLAAGSGRAWARRRDQIIYVDFAVWPPRATAATSALVTSTKGSWPDVRRCFSTSACRAPPPPACPPRGAAPGLARRARRRLDSVRGGVGTLGSNRRRNRAAPGRDLDRGSRWRARCGRQARVGADARLPAASLRSRPRRSHPLATDPLLDGKLVSPGFEQMCGITARCRRHAVASFNRADGRLLTASVDHTRMK